MHRAIDLPLSEARRGKQPHFLIFPPFGGIKGGCVKNIARISSNITKISREFYQIRQKYRENFIKYDKNIARILSDSPPLIPPKGGNNLIF